MKFELTIWYEGTKYPMSAPTFEMLEEKYGAWERAHKLEQPIDERVCEYCDLTNEHSHGN